jgi:hypothetical protein
MAKTRNPARGSSGLGDTREGERSRARSGERRGRAVNKSTQWITTGFARELRAKPLNNMQGHLGAIR